MKTKRYHQYSGLAYALDLVGERWTLLIARELFAGPRRFTDLLAGLPGISTNLLTDRLKCLEQDGLVTRRVLPPPAGSTVYELTGLGRGLEPALIELGKWGSQFVPPEPGKEAILKAGSHALALKTFFRPEQARNLDESYNLHIDDEVLHVQIQAGALRVGQGETPGASVALHTDMPAYLEMLNGRLKPCDAVTSGRARVEGDLDAIDRFMSICGLPAQDAARQEM